MRHSRKVGYIYALTDLMPYPEVGFSTITSDLPVMQEFPRFDLRKATYGDNPVHAGTKRLIGG
jgi:hypothetical protein